MNYVHFDFSSPLQKKDDPYLLYSISGKRLANWSIDYEFTLRNLHLFGEIAFDQHRDKAFVHGLLLSLDRRLDLSMVFRSISPGYESRNANTFTELSLPVNETGLFSGISFRTSSRFRMDAYVDIFSFPWLRYRVDAPSLGSDVVFQFNWQPNKRLSLYGRWKNESKEGNSTTLIGPTRELIQVGRKEASVLNLIGSAVRNFRSGKEWRHPCIQPASIWKMEFCCLVIFNIIRHSNPLIFLPG